MAEVGKLRGDTIGLVGKLFGLSALTQSALAVIRIPPSAVRDPRLQA